MCNLSLKRQDSQLTDPFKVFHQTGILGSGQIRQTSTLLHFHQYIYVAAAIEFSPSY